MKYQFSAFIYFELYSYENESWCLKKYKQFCPRKTFDFTKTLQFSCLVKALPVPVKTRSSLLVYWVESTARHGADKVREVTWRRIKIRWNINVIMYLCWNATTGKVSDNYDDWRIILCLPDERGTTKKNIRPLYDLPVRLSILSTVQCD